MNKGDSTLSVDDVVSDSDRKKESYHFDRHSAEYRSQFKTITEEMHAKCPMAWSDTYGGHWIAAGSDEVFELARCPAVSNDHDLNGERRGYKGISIPTASRINGVRGGILEMDDPEHRTYRNVLNPYLSPGREGCHARETAAPVLMDALKATPGRATSVRSWCRSRPR